MFPALHAMTARWIPAPERSTFHFTKHVRNVNWTRPHLSHVRSSGFSSADFNSNVIEKLDRFQAKQQIS
jgi:hypothetical protein